MTYGEAIYYRRNNMDFSRSIDEITEGLRKGLPKRMDKQKAIKYYTKKLKRRDIKWK